MSTDTFDIATTVVPTATSGLYDATLSRTWAIGERPHGGYLLAAIARAAADTLRRARDEAAGAAAHPHPLSTSAVFLRSPGFGPAQIAVEVLRTGRSVSHAQATLVQDCQPCVRVLHVFGPLDPGTEPRFLGEQPPNLPPMDECAPVPQPPALADGTVLRVGLREVTDTRLDPSSFPEGGPGDGGGELRAWLAFRDGRAPDPLSLLFTVDALPPVTFTLGIAGWVPTLELTAYVRAQPAPGPLRVRQRGRLLQDGRIDEVCDVWDSAGRLVAQASQLAGVRVPD